MWKSEFSCTYISMIQTWNTETRAVSGGWREGPIIMIYVIACALQPPPLPTCSRRLGTMKPQKWHRHGVERVKERKTPVQWDPSWKGKKQSHDQPVGSPMGEDCRLKPAKIVLFVLFVSNWSLQKYICQSCLLMPAPPSGVGVWCDTPDPNVRTSTH